MLRGRWAGRQAGKEGRRGKGEAKAGSGTRESGTKERERGEAEVGTRTTCPPIPTTREKVWADSDHTRVSPIGAVGSAIGACFGHSLSVAVRNRRAIHPWNSLLDTQTRAPLRGILYFPPC